MVFNTTGYNNPIELLQYFDAQTTQSGFHAFGIVFLMMITVVIFLTLSNQTSARRFATTFAIMGVISFLSFLIGFVTIQVFTFYFFAFGLSAAMLRIESNR